MFIYLFFHQLLLHWFTNMEMIIFILFFIQTYIPYTDKGFKAQKVENLALVAENALNYF